MSKFQRNLARHRAAVLRPAGPNPHHSTGFYVGPLTSTAPAGFSGRKGRRPGSDKGQRGWNRSPYYKTAATIDARWSATVSA